MNPKNKQALRAMIEAEGWDAFMRAVFAEALTQSSNKELHAEHMAGPDVARFGAVLRHQSELLGILAESLDPAIKLAQRLERMQGQAADCSVLRVP